MKKISYEQISNLLFEVEFESYELLNDEELIWLLKSNVCEERAIAARLLGEREAIEALPYLCNALSAEQEKGVSLIITESLMCLASIKK